MASALPISPPALSLERQSILPQAATFLIHFVNVGRPGPVWGEERGGARETEARERRSPHRGGAELDSSKAEERTNHIRKEA